MKTLLFTLVYLLSVILSTAAQAEAKQIKSIDYLKQNDTLDLSKRTHLLNKQESLTNNSLLSRFSLELAHTTQQDSSADYSIFDSDSVLISDFDNDGFYHRFSISVDADTLFNHSQVYADIYISYEGGPWEFFTSSNVYDIYLDDYADEFVIENELASGYPTGYYDFKIKLFDAQTDKWLVTYDSYDDASLRALPLESANRDDDYLVDDIIVDEVYVYGTGSFDSISILMLMTLGLLFVKRKLWLK